MTIRSYDLSIISAEEAADRLGVKAAEAEELLDDDPWLQPRHYGDEATIAANRATIALDILALRKAQVALSRAFVFDEIQAIRGAVHPFFAGIENDHAAISAKLMRHRHRGYREGWQQGLEEGEKLADLHRKINQAVSDALGQDITQSWHDLGEKVEKVVKENAYYRSQLKELEEQIERLERQLLRHDPPKGL